MSIFEEKEVFGDFKHSFESIENSGFRYGNLQLVGHGKVANDKCGTWHIVGCQSYDLHGRFGIGLDGVDYRKKVFVKRIPHSCNKPSCPICYPLWSWREGGSIDFRLKEASRQFAESGLVYPEVEHFIVSPSPREYGLSCENSWKNAFEAMRVRGIVGGVAIQHAFRFNKLTRRWVFGIHWHVLGYSIEKYRCRGCKKVCQPSCMGFENLTREWNKRDGFIVKIASSWEHRKSIRSTAAYQLSHSSIDISKKYYRVARWFGCASYRRLKITPEVKKAWEESKKSVCPCCKHELVPLRYFGRDARFFADDFPRKGLWMDAFEDGQFVWAEDTRESWRRG